MFHLGPEAVNLPLREVLTWCEHAEDVIEDYRELQVNIVAAGVLEALDNVKFG